MVGNLSIQIYQAIYEQKNFFYTSMNNLKVCNLFEKDLYHLGSTTHYKYWSLK